MGTNYYVTTKRPTINTPIHIGKSSMGWKFLFHEVDTYENWISEQSIRTFPQWVDFLESHEDEIVILNEYDELIALCNFLKMVERKQEEENEDNFKYDKNIDGYRFCDRSFR